MRCLPDERIQSASTDSDDRDVPLTQDYEVYKSSQHASTWVRLFRGLTVARVQSLRRRTSLPRSRDARDGRAREVGDAAVRNVRSGSHISEGSICILGSAEGEEEEEGRPDELSRQRSGAVNARALPSRAESTCREADRHVPPREQRGSGS